MSKKQKVYNEKFIHPQDKLVVLDGDKEYDVYALLKVVADLQEKLVEYGEQYSNIKYVFEQAGVSKKVFEEFDLSDIYDL